MDQYGKSESSSTSSFEILHFSNETQKLNQMIDSWSKGVNLDDQSKNIAQGLLKSALKLQESMAMLSRLQETSKFMAQMKKVEVKPNEKYKRKDDNVYDKSSGLDASNYRSMNHLCHTKFSVDGSASTDSFRNLNEVHRPGRSSKELSSTKECSFKEGGYRAERIGFGRVQNPNYVKNCNEKIKNLIKDSLVKQNLLSNSSDEKKKHFAKRQSGVLPEVHSSGLWTSLSNTFESNEKAGQPMKISKSPNLIAKLMGLEEFPAEAVRSTPQELETKNKENCYQKKPVFDIQMPKALNRQIERASDGGQTDFKEAIERKRYEGLLRCILPRDYPKSSRVQNETEDLPPIVMTKPLADSGHNGDGEKGLIDLMPRKMKYSSIKQVQGKPASKENKNVGAGKINPSKPMNPAQCHVEQQKVKSVSRKNDNVQKGLDGKNMVDIHNWKFLQAISTSIKASSAQFKKMDSIPKKCPVNKSTTKQNNDMPQPRKGASEISVDHTPKMEANNGKLQWRSSAVNPIAKKTIQRENKERSNVTQEHTNHSTTTSSSTDAHDQKIRQDGPKNPAEDCINTDRKCPVKAGAREHTPGLSFTSAENNRNPNKIMGVTTNSCERHLLLSSTLFLGKMEKLFGLKKENPSQLLSLNQAKNNTDDIRTLLDCANELLERKCYEMALVCHPLLQTHLRCNDETSLDSLMAEVIGGIDTLRGYCKTDTDSCQTDRIFFILGKDLMCKSMVVNGVWDRSWLNGISIRETEVVVNEVEKDILGGLIEETVMSLAMPVSPSISVLL